MAEKVKDRFERKEILKFLVGGGSAVLIDAAVYAVLKQKINLSFAKAISYVSGAVVGFAINKLWTFGSKRFLISEVIKYIFLYIFSAGVNALVNRTALYLTDNTVFAFLCATGTSTVINFLGQKFMYFEDWNDKAAYERLGDKSNEVIYSGALL